MNSKDQDFMCGVVEGFYGRPWTTDQRRHLFKNLRKLGMNTYLYAPKDDLKHRAEWRILYTAEETDLLESLIKAARESDVTFVYALSPGIDIIYSNPKEVKAIQEKLEQVRCLGCDAFALLFDDIEPTMNDQDRKTFPSFSEAQVTVTNNVYECLGSPIFMFCPTEYCESRAVPNLDSSEYLTILGKKLYSDIKILWTGPRVVSRFLTIDHIQRVAKVLRRKPLIWDNLHANDYDPKRVFLGPFVGRSVALKNEISGLLLNPNTKYEANFIPFFTLADWNRSENDAPKVEDDQNATLESNAQYVAIQVVEKNKPLRLYHPLTSLKKALESWLVCYTQGPGPAIPPISQMETQAIATIIDPSTTVSVPPPSIRTCEGNEMLQILELPQPVYTSPIGNATTVTVQTFPISEAIIGVAEAHENVIPQTVNSLSTDYNEPMETLSAISKEENQSSTAMEIITESSDLSIDEYGNILSLNDLPTSPIESLKTFVDIFYLPFEHGQRGVQFLQEFQWLHENAHIIRLEYYKADKKESDEWLRRFDTFKIQIHQINCLYRFIIESPNKTLVQEVFPYVWEAQGILSVLGAILAWMREGNLIIAPTETGSWWDNCAGDDLEPWSLGGGLLPDLQKLVVTTPHLADFFTIKYTIPFSLTCYSIRPISNNHDLNKHVLYEYFSTTEERERITLMIGDIHAEEMFFDRFFSPLLKYGAPAHHFIAEEFNNFSCKIGPLELEGSNNNHNQFFAVALGIFNFEGAAEDFRLQFIPQFCSKYLAIIKADVTICEVKKEERRRLLNAEVENWGLLRMPKLLLQNYTSFVEVRWRNYSTEAVAVRRLLHCVSTTLALNGSSGFFSIVESSNAEKTGLLNRVGLLNIFENSNVCDRGNMRRGNCEDKQKASAFHLLSDLTILGLIYNFEGEMRALLVHYKSLKRLFVPVSWSTNLTNTLRAFSSFSISEGNSNAFRSDDSRWRKLIDARPYTMNGGILKILLAALASMYVGGKIAQKGATFLEENEIFVHSEDDDYN